MGNSYCRRKSSARGPWFKVSSEGLPTEIDILIPSNIQMTDVCLTPVYQAVDCNSMPITTIVT